MRLLTSMIVLCLVGGCADPEDIWHHWPDRGDEDEDDTDELRCLYDSMWAVDGDTLTFAGGGVQTVPAGRSQESEGGSGYAESEPLARTGLRMRGNHGVAELSWDGMVVDRFEFDEPFFTSGERKVLSYLEADGTGVEYHLFTSASCELPIPRTGTRAEIEALEK